MKFKDLLKLALRTFRARKGRTALTVFGMGIGIGAILFLVGMGYGLQRLLLQEITTSESLATLDVSPNRAQNARLSPEKIEEISKMEGVVEATPALDAGAQVKFEETLADGSVTISSPEFFTLDGKKISSGKIFKKENKEELVVSSAFTKIFNQSEEEMLGKKLTLSIRVPKKEENIFLPAGEDSFKKEQLEKIDLTGGFIIAGFFESEELVAFMNPAGMEKDYSITQYSRLKIKCVSSEALENLRQKISNEGYSVSALSDTVQEVNRMFQGVKAVLAVFGMIALLVSAIGMFNTMTVALLERTKEIGVMKAIGASDSQILSMFILESTTMGFLGGVCGIILGVLSGVVSNFLLNVVAWKMGGKAVSLFYFPFWFLIFILVFSIVIGFLTGVVPARRASTIDPLDALKVK